MKIKDYNDAIEFFRTNDYKAADGAWSEFYQSEVLEPRIMDQAALSDDVVPGPLKDELEGKFDPSQETYEEYLQRINLERPFNMAEGGPLVGTPTKEVTQHGRRIYETPEGERVSEKSKTLFFNGKWVNVPSIHDGVQYDSEDRLRNMLKHGKIQATSEHQSQMEAEEAAASRSNMMKSHTKGFAEGQLVTPSVDGSRPGYAGKMKWTTKEIQEIYKDLPENIFVQKRVLPSGKIDYTYRAKIRYKGKLHTFPSKVATPENKKQLIKDVEAKWDKLAPNRISREEYAKLRLLPENRRLSGDEFAEKLNKKYKKVTYRGEKWNNQNVFNYDLEAPRSTKRIADDLGFFEKRTVKEAKDIINKYSGGKHFLKNKNLTDAQITTRASEYVAMEKRVAKEGGKGAWPPGRQNKRKVWTNIYNSYKQGGRFELANRKELADKDGTINWKKGTDYNKINPFETSSANWRKAKFRDKKSGAIFTYDNLEKMVDKHGGGWNKAIKAYDDNAILNQTTFNGKSLNEIIREAMIKKDYEVLVGKKVRMDDPDFLKYMGKKKPLYSFTEAHHFKGVKNYPFDTEPSFRRANREQGYIQNSYNKAVASGNPERIAKAKKVYIEKMNKLSDEMGGIRYKMDDKTFVGKSGTPESMVKVGLQETSLKPKQQMEILKKMGYRCKQSSGGGETLECYIKDVEETKAQARKGNVQAAVKQRNAFRQAKKIPQVAKLLRRGIQGVIGGVGTVFGGKMGLAIEGAIEGGIYDYYRGQGYSHEQALQEGFLTKAIDPENYTGLFNFADELIEKEKIGTRWDPSGKVNLAAKYADAKSEYDSALDKYYEIQSQRPGNLEQAEAQQAALAEQEEIIRALEPSVKAGTPEYEAYQQAEERQTALMDERARDYKSKNRFLGLEWDLSPEQIKQQTPSSFGEGKIRRQREREMDEWKGGRDAFTIKPGEYIDWGAYGLDDEEGIKEKWRQIYEEGGMDLLDRIAIAGGVSNLAEGGIASLKRK